MRDLGRNDPCWCGSGRKYKKCHLGVDEVATTRTPTAVVDPVEPGQQSPPRTVPEHIPRPDYARTGTPSEARAPATPRSADELERMRRAGRAARAVLETTAAAVRPGITTDELDAICHEETIRRGAYPSPLNYHGFPKSLCTSVNEVICHGIPDDRALRDGDIVNLDVTVYLDGMHGDNSVMCLVGDVSAEDRRLVDVTQQALVAGIVAVRPGGVVADIGRAIQAVADDAGYGVVRAFVGHGVGPSFHCEPIIPHYHDPKARTELVPGMTFTIEPMLNQGSPEHRMWDDGWTAVTADLRKSAQWEHTLVVTEHGAEVLTLGTDETPPAGG